MTRIRDRGEAIGRAQYLEVGGTHGARWKQERLFVFLLLALVGLLVAGQLEASTVEDKRLGAPRAGHDKRLAVLELLIVVHQRLGLQAKKRTPRVSHRFALLRFTAKEGGTRGRTTKLNESSDCSSPSVATWDWNLQVKRGKERTQTVSHSDLKVTCVRAPAKWGVLGRVEAEALCDLSRVRSFDGSAQT